MTFHLVEMPNFQKENLVKVPLTFPMFFFRKYEHSAKFDRARLTGRAGFVIIEERMRPDVLKTRAIAGQNWTVFKLVSAGGML